MTPINKSFADLSDDRLLDEVQRLATTERRATAALIESLMELDARRLYLGAGCSSLFTYCTRVLHLAEGAAYNRIEAARAARRFPPILAALEDGSLTLTAVRLLAPHLTADNCGQVLSAARQKSKSGIERLVASLHPRPDVQPTIRKMPERPQRREHTSAIVPHALSAQNAASAVPDRAPSSARQVVVPLR